MKSFNDGLDHDLAEASENRREITWADLDEQLTLLEESLEGVLKENHELRLVNTILTGVAIGLAMLLVVFFFSSCGGTKEDVGEGFVCVEGTDEECAVVEQAERAFGRCGEVAYYTGFYFHHDEEWAEKIGKQYCGRRYPGDKAHISQWDTEKCWNLPKYVVHEAFHAETSREGPVVEKTKRVFETCWEE